ncbi:MAG: cytochrome c [Firmicutes bacterium]|nr:cytochrome c [Bacillota bacterium]
MKRWFVWMLGIVTLIAVPLALAQKGDAVAGKAVYQKKCATCHELSGAPKAAIAKMMKVEMRDLSSKEVQAKSDEELSRNITQGTGKMVPVKGLSDADLQNLIAYLRSLKKPQ